MLSQVPAEPEEQLDTVLRDCRRIVADCTRMQATANVQIARAEAMRGRLQLLKARIEQQGVNRAERSAAPSRSRDAVAALPQPAT